MLQGLVSLGRGRVWLDLHSKCLSLLVVSRAWRNGKENGSYHIIWGILYRLPWGFIPAFPTTNGRFPARPGHIEILSEASCDGRPWATQRIKWSLPEWEPVEDTRVLLGICRDNGKENRKLLGTVLRNFRCAPGVELLAPCSSVYNPDLISVTFRELLPGG